MVSLVGIIECIDHSSNIIKYTIRDPTGEIEAHYWMEEGEANDIQALQLNQYAKVIGWLVDGNILISRITATDLASIETHCRAVRNAQQISLSNLVQPAGTGEPPSMEIIQAEPAGVGSGDSTPTVSEESGISSDDGEVAECEFKCGFCKFESFAIDILYKHYEVCENQFRPVSTVNKEREEEEKIEEEEKEK